MAPPSGLRNGNTEVVRDRTFRFGPFELKTRTGELEKLGTRIKLQAKSLQILEMLLERPGQLVTREELCAKLWSPDTFVDFESGLNTAVNRLRSALGDCAESPRYIETLPRLGYRFICPVIEAGAEHNAHDSRVEMLELERGGQAAAEGYLHAAKPETPATQRSKVLWSAVAVLAGTLCTLALLHVGARFFTGNDAKFTQLTFRAGNVRWARFTPDEKNVLYSAKWGPYEQADYLTNFQEKRTEKLKLPKWPVALSRQGELLYATHSGSEYHDPAGLWEVPLKGGSARLVAPHVSSADWAPNGKEIAAAWESSGQTVVEFPVGHRVYHSNNWINCLRVSPDGSQIAFLEHPIRDDDAGLVRRVDRHGATRTMGETWNSVDGLAWSPSGEIWFTASRGGLFRSLYAVSRSGKLRKISGMPESLRLMDISSAGRLLVAVDDARLTMLGMLAGQSAERDLTKFDMSYPDAIAPDGRMLLFTESGEAGGIHYTAYIRRAASMDAERVGDGRGLAISTDSHYVLTSDARDRGTITLTDVYSRASRQISGGGFRYQWAKFIDGIDRLLVGGSYGDGPLTIAIQDLSGGKPMAVAGATYFDQPVLSPDGKNVAGIQDEKTIVWQRETNAVTDVLGCRPNCFPVAWNKDGTSLFVACSVNNRFDISEVKMKTKQQTPWRTVGSNVPGVEGVTTVVVAPESSTYAYSMHLLLSNLYVVDGWVERS